MTLRLKGLSYFYILGFRLKCILIICITDSNACVRTRIEMAKKLKEMNENSDKEGDMLGKAADDGPLVTAIKQRFDIVNDLLRPPSKRVCCSNLTLVTAIRPFKKSLKVKVSAKWLSDDNDSFRYKDNKEGRMNSVFYLILQVRV